MLGRSDTTLNPGGVRIGTAEIYRQVEFFSEVLDAAVIGQEWQDDVRVVLFVIMKDGAELTDNLRQEIKRKIREGASRGMFQLLLKPCQIYQEQSQGRLVNSLFAISSMAKK